MKHYLAVLAVVITAAAAVAASAAGSRAAAKPPPPTTAHGAFVVSTTTGDVVRIDPATLNVVETIHLGVPYVSSIAVAGDFLYYSAYSGASSYATVGRYNLSTKQNLPAYINQQFYAPVLRASPRLPGVLFVGEAALSPADIQKWSVPAKGKRPSLLARTEHGPMGSNLGDFQISDDGTRIWSACGSPYDFVELNTSDLRLSGRVFPAVPYPTSVDSVRVGGTEYLVGGTDSVYDRSIHLYNAADPASGSHYGASGTTREVGAVTLSPDASRIYRVVTDVSGQNGSIETLSAATGDVLATFPAAISSYFVEGIDADLASGKVFVSLENAVGVLDPAGALLLTIPVAGAGQIVVT